MLSHRKTQRAQKTESNKMKRIFICSPYSGNIRENVTTAQAMCKLAIKHGYAPFAPHLLYPQLLDDTNPNQRGKGMSCGRAFLAVCNEVWQLDVPPTIGMEEELAFAHLLQIPVKKFEIKQIDVSTLGEASMITCCSAL